MKNACRIFLTWSLWFYFVGICTVIAGTLHAAQRKRLQLPLAKKIQFKSKTDTVGR